MVLFSFNYHRRIRVRHGHPFILNKQPVRGRLLESIYGLRVLNMRRLPIGSFSRVFHFALILPQLLDLQARIVKQHNVTKKLE
jgi:hypothetical protein